MADYLCRRRFVLTGSTLIGSTVLSRQLRSFFEEQILAEKRLVLLGLNALARTRK